MKKRRIAIAGILILIAVGSLVFWRSREPTYEGRSVSEWFQTLCDPDLNGKALITARKESREAIEAIGPDAIPYILKEIKSVHSPLKRYYRQIWPKLPYFMKKRLSEPMRDIHARFIASNFLSSVGPSGIPKLGQALKDNNVYIREVSVRALGTLARQGHDVSGLIPIFIELLSDTDALVRAEAADVLGELGSQSEAAVPFLVKLLDDDQKGRKPGNIVSVRASAARALGKIGIPSEKALTKLKALAAPKLSGAGSVRQSTKLSAVIALGQLTGETKKMVRQLIDLWPKIDDSLKLRILLTFGELGQAARDAAPFLVQLLNNGDPNTLPFSQSAAKRTITNTLHKIDPDYFSRTNTITSE